MLQTPLSENLTSAFMHPSQHAESKIFSPLKTPILKRFKRGKLIHNLLEYLPHHPLTEHRLLGHRFLNEKGDFSFEDQENILDQVSKFLNHPSFSSIFGPHSRAEVPLVGYLSDQLLS